MFLHLRIGYQAEPCTLIFWRRRIGEGRVELDGLTRVVIEGSERDSELSMSVLPNLPLRKRRRTHSTAKLPGSVSPILGIRSM